MSALRIGTRRSPLALAQAEEIRIRLDATGVIADIVPMSTSGDEGARADSSPQGLKGLWIDTILDALESGEIDLAVHSAKDLPAEEDEGFTIAAVPEREDPSDVLICREPGELRGGALIGTSSVRRRAQLLAAFPGLEVVDLRGNVETRLRKLEEGEVDAAVLAAAGLSRLGLAPEHARALPLAMMVPAPGQGCLAVQARDDDDDTIAALAPLDHADEPPGARSRTVADVAPRGWMRAAARSPRDRGHGGDLADRGDRDGGRHHGAPCRDRGRDARGRSRPRRRRS